MKGSGRTYFLETRGSKPYLRITGSRRVRVRSKLVQLDSELKILLPHPLRHFGQQNERPFSPSL